VAYHIVPTLKVNPIEELQGASDAYIKAYRDFKKKSIHDGIITQYGMPQVYNMALKKKDKEYYRYAPFHTYPLRQFLSFLNQYQDIRLF
jgi:hypothetical protein